MPPDPRVHVGVCAIVLHPHNDDLMLFQHRMGQGEYAGDGFGTWAFPGGWLDFGETPEEAAVREVKEELDLDVEVYAPMGYTSNLSENGRFQIVTLFFECVQRNTSLVPRIVEPDKVDEIAYVTRSTACHYPLFAATERYLVELAR